MKKLEKRDKTVKIMAVEFRTVKFCRGYEISQPLQNCSLFSASTVLPSGSVALSSN